jgi:hypothetical protein
VLVGDGSGGDEDERLVGSGERTAVSDPAPQAPANTATTARRTVRRWNRLGVDDFIRPMIEPPGNLPFTPG